MQASAALFDMPVLLSNSSCQFFFFISAAASVHVRSLACYNKLIGSIFARCGELQPGKWLCVKFVAPGDSFMCKILTW